MGFVDSFNWLIVSVGFLARLPIIAVIVGLFLVFWVALFKRRFFVAFMAFLCVCIFLFAIYRMAQNFPPTEERVIELYENGDIDKRGLKKFIPYAIEIDKEDRRDREERRAEKNRGKEALKTLEEKKAKRKKEAEELVKKFKEKEKEYELY